MRGVRRSQLERDNSTLVWTFERPRVVSVLFFHPKNISGWWNTLGLVRRKPAPLLSRCKLHDQVFEMPVEVADLLGLVLVDKVVLLVGATFC